MNVRTYEVNPFAIDTVRIVPVGAYGGGGGLSDEAKQAILDAFEHVAWTDDQGQTYVDAIRDAFYPPATLLRIQAVYTQSGTVYTTDSLDSLKSDLVVTAVYTDSSTETVTTYTLSGTLTAGESTITVSYGGKTTTFKVNVTAPATLDSISAVYTQSGTVYTTDSLDSLKEDLVVTATYSDSSTSTVAAADYTLSGTLTEGTSIITATYEGKTATFNVTVTRYVTYDYIYNSLPYSSSATWNEYVDTGLKYNPCFSTLNVEFECINSNDTNTSGALMGAGYNYSNNNASFIWYARTNKAGYSAYYFKTAKQLNTAPGDTRCVCKFFFVDGGQSYMQYDSTVVNVATVSASSITPSNESLILAGAYQNDGSRKYGLAGGAKAKLGYVKFTDPSSNELLYNFIPAHDVSEDKWGFYEAVNGVFYPSNGSDYRCANWGA